MRTCYSFDDVLLTPQYSDIESRRQVDISSELDSSCFRHDNDNTGVILKLPVISSPMDTVTERHMAVAMQRSGGLGIVHRYNTIDDQTKEVFKAAETYLGPVGAAIGMTDDYLDRATSLVTGGASILCVDVAHGHHSMMERCIKSLKDEWPDVHVMAGNVATREAFDAIASWGADSIRVGIGGGSICSTRLVTGHGIPTFQSILDCAQTSYDTKIIADGGIKTTGDIVKAYAAGADFVMIGSMLAGTSETPGEVFSGNSGKKYKVYRGMASSAAQKAWRGKSSAPEGVSTTIPFRGSVEHILQNIAGGIRSGLSYSGARSLAELRSKASFILQSSASQLESSTHILGRNR